MPGCPLSRSFRNGFFRRDEACFAGKRAFPLMGIVENGRNPVEWIDVQDDLISIHIFNSELFMMVTK